MIDYDPHRWWDRLFYVRGSMIYDIAPRALACVVWSGAVVWFHEHVHAVNMPLSIHTLAGVALSLLLVFRTNASYDRFWEGRKLWGGIVNETRNLGRAARIFLREDPALYQDLVHWTTCFPYAAAGHLRGLRDLGPAAAQLPSSAVEGVLGAQHVPLSVSAKMSEALDEGRRRGHYSDFVQLQLDQNVQLLIDYLGGCERIHKTPLPFAYVVHLRRALVLYLLTFPFGLVKEFGWGTVLGTLAVAYVFFGIEEIGVEIEDPFGHDDNDLPLARICQTIQTNLAALLPDDLVEGKSAGGKPEGA